MSSKFATKFKERMKHNIEHDKGGGSTYGHLNLPSGVNVFKEDPKQRRIKLDFMMYMVTSNNHPDRDDKTGDAMPGEPWYRYPYKLHRGVGSGNESVVCPGSFGKKCPICEHRAQLAKTPKVGLPPAELKALEEQLKQLKASARNLYVVVPIEVDKFEQKPHIWDISYHIFQKKLKEELDEKPQFLGFCLPDEGYTLSIRLSEEQLGENKFAGVSRIDFEDRAKQYDPESINKMPNLDNVLILLSYEDIHNKFFGLEPENEPPAAMPSSPEPERKPKSAVEDEHQQREEPRRTEPAAPAEEIRRKPKEEPAAAPASPAPASGGETCPHGYVYGKDVDKKDECDKCAKWDACFDFQRKSKK